jgi:hypothetical protein
MDRVTEAFILACSNLDPDSAAHAQRVKEAVGDLSKKYNDIELIALSHDVVEEGHYTLDQAVRVFRLSVTSAKTLDKLTRKPGEVYSEYIDRVMTDDMAVEIKLADLRDNMQRCVDDIDNRWSLLIRYAKAYGKIMKGR